MTLTFFICHLKKLHADAKDMLPGFLIFKVPEILKSEDVMRTGVFIAFIIYSSADFFYLHLNC